MMASTLSEDFEDKMNIKATTTDVVEGVSCAACGKEGASKKCKKRHRGCDQKRFCNSGCHGIGHKKEKVKKGDDEVEAENVEMDLPTIDDAAIAKMKKKKKEERKARKKAKRIGGVATHSQVRVTYI